MPGFWPRLSCADSGEREVRGLPGTARRAAGPRQVNRRLAPGVLLGDLADERSLRRAGFHENHAVRGHAGDRGDRVFRVRHGNVGRSGTGQAASQRQPVVGLLRGSVVLPCWRRLHRPVGAGACAGRGMERQRVAAAERSTRKEPGQHLLHERFLLHGIGRADWPPDVERQNLACPAAPGGPVHRRLLRQSAAVHGGPRRS